MHIWPAHMTKGVNWCVRGVGWEYVCVHVFGVCVHARLKLAWGLGTRVAGGGDVGVCMLACVRVWVGVGVHVHA